VAAGPAASIRPRPAGSRRRSRGGDWRRCWARGCAGSGGGVAGIDGGGRPCCFALFVQAQEGGFRHDDFAADFKGLRQAAFLSLAAEMESGTLRMVRMFEVTSSPIWPSPRVMPRTP
jgi:hypothetical protein